MDVDHEDADMFGTPEEAALSGWKNTPSAGATVVDVRYDGNDAEVTIRTSGHPHYDLDYVMCRRLPNGLWIEGPSTGGGSI